jgi:hypothetical protein
MFFGKPTTNESIDQLKLQHTCWYVINNTLKIMFFGMLNP